MGPITDAGEAADGGGGSGRGERCRGGERREDEGRAGHSPGAAA